jgi:hypothetical protein
VVVSISSQVALHEFTFVFQVLWKNMQECSFHKPDLRFSSTHFVIVVLSYQIQMMTLLTASYKASSTKPCFA